MVDYSKWKDIEVRDGDFVYVYLATVPHYEMLSNISYAEFFLKYGFNWYSCICLFLFQISDDEDDVSWVTL